jgi:hypothetical protein
MTRKAATSSLKLLIPNSKLLTTQDVVYHAPAVAARSGAVKKISGKRKKRFDLADKLCYIQSYLSADRLVFVRKNMPDHRTGRHGLK